jgi:O-succinylbenzoate synthase
MRRPVRTAHGLWAERTGVIVRLATEDGRSGWGEAAPIPQFGMETAAEVVAACAALADRWDPSGGADLGTRWPTLANALAFAGEEIDRPQVCAESSVEAKPGREALAVAALLPAGRPALAAVASLADIGFRTYKWKVGVGDPQQELGLLDDVCAALPGGAKLRLDANGAWDGRTAERWLERAADRPVEFIEQPIALDARGADDRLRGLAGDFPTPLALDESLVGDGDLRHWLDLGWPGLFVFKPLLHADPRGALDRLAQAKARVVFSSSLETAVGARSALRAAFDFPGEKRALGFGVWPLFERPEFDGPAGAPFLYRSEVAALDPQAAWDALAADES